MLLTKTIPPETFASIVLIEPTLSTKALFDSHREDRMARVDFAVAATRIRRDHWLSRQQAFEYFKKRVPWDIWDDRVIRLMAVSLCFPVSPIHNLTAAQEHGLEDSPAGGVRLKWDKNHEAASYLDMDPHFEGAIQLGKVCHSVPIHVIWGTRIDLVQVVLSAYNSIAFAHQGDFSDPNSSKNH